MTKYMRWNLVIARGIVVKADWILQMLAAEEQEDFESSPGGPERQFEMQRNLKMLGEARKYLDGAMSEIDRI